MNTAVALDHVGVAARDLGPMTAAYERLGFALSPIAQQSGKRRPDLPVEPWGSGNRCAFLKHGYIELIAILDPALYDNTLNAFLARYPGMHIPQRRSRMEITSPARGSYSGIAWLERPVEAGGPIAKFARLPFPDPPEGRVQLIRHLTPELVWNPKWMDHANKAEALEEVIISAAEPAETAARLSRLCGLPVEPDPAGGFLLRLPGAAAAAGPFTPVMETRVRASTGQRLGDRAPPASSAPASPFMAGMVIRTSDAGTAARRVLEASRPSRRRRG